MYQISAAYGRSKLSHRDSFRAYGTFQRSRTLHRGRPVVSCSSATRPKTIKDYQIAGPLGVVTLVAGIFGGGGWLLAASGVTLIASSVYNISCEKQGRRFGTAVQWFMGPVFVNIYECIVMSILNPGNLVARMMIGVTAWALMAFTTTSAARRAFRLSSKRSSSSLGRSGGGNVYREQTNPPLDTKNEFSMGTSEQTNVLGNTHSTSMIGSGLSVGSDDDEDFSFDELADRARKKRAGISASMDQVQEAMGGIIRDEVFTTNPWAFINTLVLLTGAVIYDNGVWTAWDDLFGDSPEWSSATAVLVGLLIVVSVRIFKIPVASKIPWEED